MEIKIVTCVQDTQIQARVKYISNFRPKWLKSIPLFKPKPLKSLPRCTYEGGSNPPSLPHPGEVLFLQFLMAIEINKLLKMSLRESSLEVDFTDKTLRG